MDEPDVRLGEFQVPQVHLCIYRNARIRRSSRDNVDTRDGMCM
jgi:hypothetical protein